MTATSALALEVFVTLHQITPQAALVYRRELAQPREAAVDSP
jgi:hypothetical protein